MAPTPAASLGQGPGLGGGMGIQQLMAMLAQKGGGLGGMPPPGMGAPPMGGDPMGSEMGMMPPGMGMSGPPGMGPPGMPGMGMMGEEGQGESMLQQILTMLMMGQQMPNSFMQNASNTFGQPPESSMPPMM